MNLKYKNYQYMSILFIIFIVNGCVTNEKYNLDSELNVNDPFENTNRTIFSFNESLDDYLFEPVARGWRKIPSFPRDNLSNLAETANAPLDIANSILQFDIESVRINLSRFLINLTFGLGGMYDVASTDMFGNIEKRNEDFGQTLATWGLSEGPYVMLPIFGPSNIRDAFGRGMDNIFNPLTFTFRMNGLGFETRLPQPVVSGASTREKYLDYIEEIEESSLDFYATMRSLYRQKRDKDIRNGKKKIQNINYEIPNYDNTYDPNLEQDKPEIIQMNKNIMNKPKKSLPSSDYPEYNETDLLTN